MSDLDVLLPSIVAGDESSFGRFVAGSEPRLRGARRPFAIHRDTEALLQETLLRLWQIAPRIVVDGKGDSLLRMGFVIARRLAISELRRRRVSAAEADALERESEHAATASSPNETDPLLRRLIRICVEALPARPRDAWAARLDEHGGCPDRDLAARLGMTLNTFLQNVTRARRQLVACLEARGVRASEALR